MSTGRTLTEAVDVVCLGETMGQFVPKDGRGVQEADSFALHHAGAESNVAIGLERLGYNAAWASRLGNDAVGRRLRSEIQREGVGTSLVLTMDDRPTGIFLKDPSPGASSVSYYRRGSAASCLDGSDIDRALAVSPRIVHLSGITPALSESCDAAVGYGLLAARQKGVVTSFDVNYRSALWPRRDDAAARLAELANTSDIVFVGLDEAESLWGARTVEAVREVIPEARTLVVKDGAHRAVSFGKDGITSVSALSVGIVESVGAGDAFAAGWLGGVLGGYGPVVALRFGHLLARAALTSLSDQGEALSLATITELATDESLWTGHDDVNS